MKDFVKKIAFASKLHAAGFLSDEQEAELINIAMKNFSVGTAQKPAADNKTTDSEKALIDAFYEVAARKELKDFFEKNVSQKSDELNNALSEMIKKIEAEAISGHEKQKNFSNNLKLSNDNAKEKLFSQAQASKALETEPERIFTRADLSNMSNDDYKKFEKIIFEQAKKGLIH